MKVIFAKTNGFCAGARKAIELAEENPNAVVIGCGIIRNPAEMARLEKSFGITVQSDYKEIKPNQTAIISAHGISPLIKNELLDKGIKLIDTTCLVVKKVQEKIFELSKSKHHIILLGDKYHPEVKGQLGFASDNISVVKDVNEFKKILSEIMHKEKIAVLSQTTKDKNDLFEMSKILSENNIKHDVFDTICPSVEARKDEVIEIAKQVDCVIVLGGKKSNNTKLLAQTSEKYCPTYHIEDFKELSMVELKRMKSCGLISGASTPDYLVAAVKQQIEAL